MTDQSNRPAVLVLGANGRLGLAATRAFAAAGWAVTAQTRRAPRTPLPSGVRPLQCDALDLPTLTRAAEGAAVIVQAVNPAYTDWGRELPAITEATLALAQASGARLMVAGSVYVFGRELPPVLTERTPVVANHAKAAQRIAWEQALADAARTRGVKTVLIRAGDFLGDEGTWLDLAMARSLRRGVFTHPGPGDLAHAWAWLPDLAQVFVKVAERRAALADYTALHYAGLTLTSAQVQAALEAALGRPLRAQAMAWWPLQLAALVAPMPRALLEVRHLWQRPHRLDETRLAALIGEVPHTPLAQVMRNAAASLPGALPDLGMAGVSRAA